MPVVDLRGSPTGMEGLGEGLGALVQGLRGLIDPKGVKEEKLRAFVTENPEMGAQMSSAVRNYVMSMEGQGQINPDDIPFAAMGMTDRLAAEMLNMFPPTTEELVERRERGGGAVEEIVAGRVAERGAKTAEAKARTVTAGLQERTATILTELDFPALQAAATMATTGLEEGAATERIASLRQYQDGLEGLNPWDRFLAATSLSNPQFASILAAREARDWQEEMMKLKDAGDQQEMGFKLLDARINLNREAAKLMDDIRTAKDEGDDTALQGLVARINQLAEAQLQFFPQDVVTIAEGVERIIGSRLKDVDFGVLTLTDFKVERAAQLIASQEATMEQLLQTQGIDSNLVGAIQRRAQEIRGDRPNRSVTGSIGEMGEQGLFDMSREDVQERITEIETLVEGGGLPFAERSRLWDERWKLKALGWLRPSSDPKPSPTGGVM